MTDLGGYRSRDHVRMGLGGDSRNNTRGLFYMYGIVFEVVLGLFRPRNVEFVSRRPVEFFFAPINIQRVAGRSISRIELFAHPARTDKLPGLADNHRPAEDRDNQ